MVDENIEKKWELLFNEDEIQEEETESEEAEVMEEPIMEEHKEHKEIVKKRVREKGSDKSAVEISDGFMTISGIKVKVTPGCEVEVGNARFVFEENSVKIYGV